MPFISHSREIQMQTHCLLFVTYTNVKFNRNSTRYKIIWNPIYMVGFERVARSELVRSHKLSGRSLFVVCKSRYGCRHVVRESARYRITSSRNLSHEVKWRSAAAVSAREYPWLWTAAQIEERTTSLWATFLNLIWMPDTFQIVENLLNHNLNDMQTGVNTRNRMHLVYAQYALALSYINVIWWNNRAIYIHILYLSKAFEVRPSVWWIDWEWLFEWASRRMNYYRTIYAITTLTFSVSMNLMCWTCVARLLV